MAESPIVGRILQRSPRTCARQRAFLGAAGRIASWSREPRVSGVSRAATIPYPQPCEPDCTARVGSAASPAFVPRFGELSVECLRVSPVQRPEKAGERFSPLLAVCGGARPGRLGPVTLQGSARGEYLT